MSKRVIRHTYEQLEGLLMTTAKKITKHFGQGDPLDGDEVFSVSTLFSLVLDLDNGNITQEEFDIEVEKELDVGHLPIARKKTKNG